MKKKILSFLLSATLMTAAVAPTTPPIIAQNTPEPFEYVEPAEGLILDSTVTPKSDGSYHIKLDSYVTSAHTPLDVVLVLDTSSNMNKPFGSNGGTRFDAMKTAAKDFVHKLRESYSISSHHHVGIVAYSNTASTVTPYLVEVKSDAAESLLDDYINGLHTGGETRYLDEAMKRAKDLMGAYAEGDQNHPNEHQKVVVVLSSGKPKSDDEDFTPSIANSAIATAREMKQQGTLIYSIGMFNEAKPGELYGTEDDFGHWPYHGSDDGSETDHWCEWSDATKKPPFKRDDPANNRFFNYLSSNYPDAKDLGLKYYDVHFPHILTSAGWEITTNYTRDTSPDANYYQAATDPEALNKVFADIVNKTLEAHINLDTTAVLKETVSPYFDIVKDSVQCSTIESTGNLDFAQDGTPFTDAVVQTDGNTISVSGFDYDKNCVTPSPKANGSYGSKLVVEFDVTPKAGFIGGNSVPVCGGGESGMYQRGTINVCSLPEKFADVAIKSYAVKATDQTIFLGETADLANRIIIPETVNGVNNAFVAITYTLKTSEQKAGTYTIHAGKTKGNWTWENGETAKPALSETTNYEISCAVAPTSGTGEFTGAAQFTVHVESGTLTITRTNGTADESYVLNIVKDGAHYMTVDVENDKPIIIVQVPEGNYTVTEDKNWTWRYGESTSNPQSVNIGKENSNGSLTVSAEKNNSKWLNDYDKGGAQ